MTKKRLGWLLVIVLALAALLCSRPVQRMSYRVDHIQLILRTSNQQGVSPYLVAAVIFTESRFRSQAQSEVGAVGLMQLMPETAKEISARLDDPAITVGRLSEPEVNITLGVAYLKELQERFPSPELMLAAYNAGPTLVDKWRAEGGTIPYPETRSFVAAVLRHQVRLQELFPEWVSTTTNERSEDTR